MEKTELRTLDDLAKNRDSAEAPIKVVYGHNLGNRTFLLKTSMYDFFRMSQVANERGQNGEPVSQRKLDPDHAKKLATYILRGLVSATIRRREHKGEAVPQVFEEVQQRLGRQPYVSLQPIVANLRTCNRDGSDLRGAPLEVDGETIAFKFWVGQRDILWVVDGQHRRKAMDLVFSFLDDARVTMRYPKRKQSLYVSDQQEISPDELQVWLECYDVARGYCTVMIELHLGLGVDEERQLFHDLNNLGKRVESSLALEFDSSNPVNSFIKEELIGKGVVEVVDRDVVNWDDDTGAIARKDLVAVNAHLFLHKSNINGAVPPVVEPRIPVAQRFWEAVTSIPGFGEPRAKPTTVAAQPVVMKALAKLTYDFAFSRQRNDVHLDQLLDGITNIDFSHHNPLWRYYDLSQEEREQYSLTSLADFLPSSDEGKNRDVGSYDPTFKVVRYGSKHNDIFPIIGDFIRWALALPNRHSPKTDVEGEITV